MYYTCILEGQRTKAIIACSDEKHNINHKLQKVCMHACSSRQEGLHIMHDIISDSLGYHRIFIAYYTPPRTSRVNMIPPE